jgi:FixJ family two-component response regulator
MPLTAEERAIVRHLLDGLQSKEIASRMGISIRSMERRRAAMMVRLGFQGDLIGFVRWALEEKIGPPL